MLVARVDGVSSLDEPISRVNPLRTLFHESPSKGAPAPRVVSTPVNTGCGHNPTLRAHPILVPVCRAPPVTFDPPSRAVTPPPRPTSSPPRLLERHTLKDSFIQIPGIPKAPLPPSPRHPKQALFLNKFFPLAPHHLCGGARSDEETHTTSEGHQSDSDDSESSESSESSKGTGPDERTVQRPLPSHAPSWTPDLTPQGLPPQVDNMDDPTNPFDDNRTRPEHYSTSIQRDWGTPGVTSQPQVELPMPSLPGRVPAAGPVRAHTPPPKTTPYTRPPSQAEELDEGGLFDHRARTSSRLGRASPKARSISRGRISIPPPATYPPPPHDPSTFPLFEHGAVFVKREDALAPPTPFVPAPSSSPPPPDSSFPPDQDPLPKLREALDFIAESARLHVSTVEHDQHEPDAIVSHTIFPVLQSDNPDTPPIAYAPVRWTIDFATMVTGTLLGPNGLNWASLGCFLQDLAAHFPVEGDARDFDRFLKLLPRISPADSYVERRIHASFSRAYPTDITSKFDKMKVDLTLAQEVAQAATKGRKFAEEAAQKAIQQESMRADAVKAALDQANHDLAGLKQREALLTQELERTWALLDQAKRQTAPPLAPAPPMDVDPSKCYERIVT